ncbi:MAG: hypothetical protein ACMZ64_07440 [Oleiphilus sp.]
MKVIKSIITLGIALAASSSFAGQIAGKNTFLIQGYWPTHIAADPGDKGKADGYRYWETSKFYNNGNGIVRHADGSINERGDPNTRILYYDSGRTLKGAGNTGQNVANQLKDIFNADPGFCNDGCVLVTHSTGEIVMRYVMNPINAGLLGSHADKLKIDAVIEMAGAGGGTDLADIGYGLFSGVNYGSAIANAISSWIGTDITLPSTRIGMTYDLKPSVARSLAQEGSTPVVPHLRVAATGDELFGLVTHPLIKGRDDSVLPLHSTCGASYEASFDSCVDDLAMDGRVKYVSKHPNAYYDYHYPLIMSEDMPHNDMPQKINYWSYQNLLVLPWYVQGRNMTFALSESNRYENSGNTPLEVDVEYHHKWKWFKKYRYITNASNKSMSEVILDSFE